MDHCLAKHLISVYGDITLDDAAAAAPRASEAARRRAQQRQQHDGTQELLEFVGGEGAALHECGSYTMLAIAEHLKKALSSADAADFSCRRREGKGKGGEEMIKTLKVTRREFEGAACGEVFARALAPVDRVLESNGMKHEEVDEVVMVGGELFGWEGMEEGYVCVCVCDSDGVTLFLAPFVSACSLPAVSLSHSIPISIPT